MANLSNKISILIDKDLKKAGEKSLRKDEID